MPDLALAIAARGPCDPAPFWEALGEGGYGDRNRVELHLAYDDASALQGMPGGVTAHLLPPSSIFQLWGAAIGESSAPYVAVLSIHSPPHRGWLEAMLAAIESRSFAFFGPVEERYPKGDPRIIGYLIEYGQFHRPLSPALEEIPGSNLVIHRKELPPAAVLATAGFLKTDLLDDWRGRAVRPTYVEDAAVIHRRPFSLPGYCRRRYDHGRAYAARRLQSNGAPSRLLALAFTPALPFLRTWRILSRTRHVPRLRKAALAHLLPILVAETCWSAGEFVGYARGEAKRPALLD